MPPRAQAQRNVGNAEAGVRHREIRIGIDGLLHVHERAARVAGVDALLAERVKPHGLERPGRHLGERHRRVRDRVGRFAEARSKRLTDRVHPSRKLAGVRELARSVCPNGRRPVASSYSTTPSAHTSVHGPTR